MRKTKDINVEMYRVVEDLNPFIKVDFMDKNGQEKSALMLLDSGSNTNFLTNEAARYIGDLRRYEDTEMEITDSVGEVIMADYGRFSFSFGGKQFSEDFGIKSNCNLGNVGDMPIIGLLGNIFMQQHGLVIDYSDYTVHTSDIVRTGIYFSDCDFVFSMEIGLKNYGVPVLAIHHDGTDVAAIADTGSTANVVSTKCINNCKLNCDFSDEIYTLRGLKGSSEAKWANVHFNLLSLREKGVESVPFHDSFMVIDHSVAEGYIFNENQLQPIEGLIGSPFMAKQGWTLDFAQKVIYKRKSN